MSSFLSCNFYFSTCVYFSKSFCFETWIWHFPPNSTSMSLWTVASWQISMVCAWILGVSYLVNLASMRSERDSKWWECLLLCWLLNLNYDFFLLSVVFSYRISPLKSVIKKLDSVSAWLVSIWYEKYKFNWCIECICNLFARSRSLKHRMGWCSRRFSSTNSKPAPFEAFLPFSDIFPTSSPMSCIFFLPPQ